MTVPGITTLQTSTSGPELPGAFVAGTATYYELATTATFSGTLEVCIAYDEADARMIANAIGKPETGKVDIGNFLPGGRDKAALDGFGYVYDYSLQGLGYGPGDVTRYMNGAPTQVQSLMGAPLQVQSLAGLGASPNTVSVVGPMSASLM